MIACRRAVTRGWEMDWETSDWAQCERQQHPYDRTAAQPLARRASDRNEADTASSAATVDRQEPLLSRHALRTALRSFKHHRCTIVVRGEPALRHGQAAIYLNQTMRADP